MEHVTYLGLGTNLGDRQAQLDQACRKIEKLIGHIVGQSAYVETEPWGFQSDNRFLNAVVAVSTRLSPRQLLSATQHIERLLGRRRKSVAGVYHDRPIDIDILLYDHVVVDEPDLKIPHPKMFLREFVMKPLQEIMPPDEWQQLQHLAADLNGISRD